MNIQDFSFNPFALNTAQHLWQSEKTPPIVKGVTAASGAIYDLFVLNPYNLTFGNCNTLITSQEPRSIQTKIAVCSAIAFGSLYSLMLYGTTIHLSGRCLLGLGSHFVKAGEILQKLGTNLFVAGALPIYSLCYAFPKYLAKTLPPVLDAVAAKMTVVGQWTFKNLLQPFWNRVIVPAAEIGTKALRFAAAKIGAALEVVGNKIATYSKLVFKEVLVPFWEKTLFPLLHKFGNTLHKIATSLTPLLNNLKERIVYAANWAFQHLVTPAWNQVILPTLKSAERIVKVAAEMLKEATLATVKTASMIFQKFIVPAYKESVLVIQAAGKYLDQNVIQPLSPLLKNAAQQVSQVSVKIFNTIIVPAAKAVAESARSIFDTAIVPTAKVVADSARLFKDKLLEINNIMLLKMQAVWH